MYHCFQLNSNVDQWAQQMKETLLRGNDQTVADELMFLCLCMWQEQVVLCRFYECSVGYLLVSHYFCVFLCIQWSIKCTQSYRKWILYTTHLIQERERERRMKNKIDWPMWLVHKLHCSLLVYLFTCFLFKAQFVRLSCSTRNTQAKRDLFCWSCIVRVAVAPRIHLASLNS